MIHEPEDTKPGYEIVDDEVLEASVGGAAIAPGADGIVVAASPDQGLDGVVVKP